jgi:hypothetical protein
MPYQPSAFAAPNYSAAPTTGYAGATPGLSNNPAGWEAVGWDPYAPVDLTLPTGSNSYGAGGGTGTMGTPPPMDPFFSDFMKNFNKEEAGINKQRRLASRLRAPVAPTAAAPRAPVPAPIQGSTARTHAAVGRDLGYTPTPAQAELDYAKRILGGAPVLTGGRGR